MQRSTHSLKILASFAVLVSFAVAFSCAQSRNETSQHTEPAIVYGATPENPVIGPGAIYFPSTSGNVSIQQVGLFATPDSGNGDSGYSLTLQAMPGQSVYGAYTAGNGGNVNVSAGAPGINNSDAAGTGSPGQINFWVGDAQVSYWIANGEVIPTGYLNLLQGDASIGYQQIALENKYINFQGTSEWFPCIDFNQDVSNPTVPDGSVLFQQQICDFGAQIALYDQYGYVWNNWYLSTNSLSTIGTFFVGVAEMQYSPTGGNSLATAFQIDTAAYTTTASGTGAVGPTIRVVSGTGQASTAGTGGIGGSFLAYGGEGGVSTAATGTGGAGGASENIGGIGGAGGKNGIGGLGGSAGSIGGNGGTGDAGGDGGNAFLITGAGGVGHASNGSPGLAYIQIGGTSGSIVQQWGLTPILNPAFVTLSPNGNTALTAANVEFPTIDLAAVTLDGSATLTFPSVTGYSGFIDISAVTLNSQTLTVKSSAGAACSAISSTTYGLVAVRVKPDASISCGN